MNPAGAAFLAKLKEFRGQCGSPSCRELAAISDEVVELHKERKLPRLSASAVSEILGGKRADLPSSAWVTSFVLCCQRYAWNIGRLAEDPGLGSLPAWQEELQIARAAIEAPTPDDTLPAPGATPLARAEYDHVAAQGPYGRTLLASLAAGDPDAAYQVAVVLAATPSHRDAAVALLLQAGTARHLLALELLEAEAERFEDAVAGSAYALGRVAAAEGRNDAAVVFFACAARCSSLPDCVEVAATLFGRVR